MQGAGRRNRQRSGTSRQETGSKAGMLRSGSELDNLANAWGKEGWYMSRGDNEEMGLVCWWVRGSGGGTQQQRRWGMAAMEHYGAVFL